MIRDICGGGGSGGGDKPVTPIKNGEGSRENEMERRKNAKNVCFFFLGRKIPSCAVVVDVVVVAAPLPSWRQFHGHFLA